MGGGKGEIEITGSGTSPVSEYAQMFSVLSDEFPVFEDGAGEVEEMLSGNWVNDGGPPWYYPFTEITLSDFDYFGFSLYAFFTNEVSSIGALAADGDYFLDLGANRVYIYGYLGSAPAADGYLHACEDQLLLIGAGPLVMPEQVYPPGEIGIRKIGDFHNGTFKYTGLKRQNLHAIGDKVHGFAEGSKNDADWDQGESNRIGHFYSNDGGETWNWSSQWLYRQPITWEQPFPDPPEIIDADEYDVPFDMTPCRIGNATSSFGNMGGDHGFMPMSGDGTLMLYIPQSSLQNSFFFTPDGGATWRKAMHFNTVAKKDSRDLAVPGNRFEQECVCRDARVLVDPSPTTGWGWTTYWMDRRQAPNNCIIKLDLAKIKTEIPPLFLAFWGYLPGYDMSDNAEALIQSSGSVFSGSPEWITSTYDPIADQMWLHVMTLRWISNTSAKMYYYRSSDEGVSWSGVEFMPTHDPNYVASGGNTEQQGLRSPKSIQFFISPECQTLWMWANFGTTNGPFTERASSHLYRSIDHGVSWDKLSSGISGNHPWAAGAYNSAGGYVNAHTAGGVQIIFLDSEIPSREFIIRARRWYFEEFYHWTLNETGSHIGLVNTTDRISHDERFFFNFFHAGGSHPIWGAGNLDPDWVCGFTTAGRNWQKLDQWHFMVPNQADFSDNFGGFNCTNSWSTGGGLVNPYTRGGVAEVTITPSDATFYGICDEAGFIIRAEHVNGLIRKLQELQSRVLARGTDATDFGIETGHMRRVTPGAGDTEGDPIRAEEYDHLRTEFEDKIKTQVPPDAGGAYYIEGIDLYDDEYEILQPEPNDQIDGIEAPNPVATISIRTLIAMRKIIQALYVSGWFCACHQYCPCQTDITVTGEKK